MVVPTFEGAGSTTKEENSTAGVAVRGSFLGLRQRASAVLLRPSLPLFPPSQHDTDSLFLRRGGLCLPKPGRRRQSLPPAPAGPSTLSVPRASRSEPEDRDVARCSAGSTRLLRRRSLSRCDRDRRLCRNPALRLGPSMCQTESPFLCATPSSHWLSGSSASAYCRHVEKLCGAESDRLSLLVLVLGLPLTPFTSSGSSNMSWVSSSVVLASVLRPVDLLDSRECSRMPEATETLRDSTPGNSSLPAGIVRRVWHRASSCWVNPSPSPPINNIVGLVIWKSEHRVTGTGDSSVLAPTVPITCQPCATFNFSMSSRLSHPYTPVTSMTPELALLTTGDSGQLWRMLLMTRSTPRK
ncbi:hypothetical protein EYF80_038179 [Liparis tanakae]|uniref:Uncharacterized protein n=1 Tax=Liparis tanakae TaxID=230148 RepID=A0A4Z2GFD7_9TELE|nr:hypothetical protein EYF80_038179 [Liparis tanakae]